MKRKILVSIIIVLMCVLVACGAGGSGSGTAGSDSGTAGSDADCSADSDADASAGSDGDASAGSDADASAGAYSIDALSAFDPSDMSGYVGLDGYQLEEELPFVDVTVQDIHKLIEEKSTFALFISFADCPWCNAIIKYFAEVCAEQHHAFGHDILVACLDTRKNPAWQSNLDIDDYDLFVEDFNDYLEYDSDNIKHLYVPHVFFIKDGAVVYEHQGAIPAMGSDPNMVLSEAQEEELRNIYREGFQALQ